MESIAALILRAWERVYPKLLADPIERARRIARRRLAVLNRPPRAWCIAIRASDTRLRGWADCRPGPNHPYRYAEHEVTLTARTLRELCAPVRIAPPGEPLDDVAAKLGCAAASLAYARAHGVFSVRHIKGLGGKIGAQVPMLFTREPLDPPVVAFSPAAPPDLRQRLPDDFEQIIARSPAYVSYRRWDEPKFRGWKWICPSCRRQVRVLYCPMPPATLSEYLNLHPATLRPLRPIRGSRPQARPGPSADAPDSPGAPDSPDAIERPPPTFACFECHRIRIDAPSERTFWNNLIAHLTGGLLYGREVRKPDGFKPLRQYNYHPQLHRAAPRRDEVLKHLLAGLSNRRIAREMGVSIRAVGNHVLALCRQERVRNRHGLVRKLSTKRGGEPVTLPPNQDERARHRRRLVQRRLLRGESYRMIMKELSLDFSTVNRDAMKIYKTHGVSGVKGLAKKLGVTLPKERRLAEIESRLRAGESYNQIAREMGLSYNQVHDQVKRIDRARRAAGTLAAKQPRRPGGGRTVLDLRCARRTSESLRCA